MTLASRFFALITLFHVVIAQTSPQPRWGHAAALVGANLYIYGGKAGISPDTAKQSGDLLLLNLAQAFSSTSPSLTTIQQTGGPIVAFHTASPVDGDQLVIFGGSALNNTASPTFSYDINKHTWSQFTAVRPQRRYEHTAVTTSSGQSTYIFGGVADQSTGATASTTFGDLFRISPSTDNSTFALATLQDVNPPTPRFHHSATMLSTNQMVIIGGTDGTNMFDMSEIWVFDTNTNAWQKKIATGQIPVPRRDHVACATPDDKIVVWGGTNVTFSQYFNEISVLDTKTMTWSQPSISGTVPAGRYSHTCTSYGQYIIFAFGFTSSGGDSSINIFETNNMAWSTSFTPANAIVPAATSASSGGPAATDTDSPATSTQSTGTARPSPDAASQLMTPSSTLIYVGVALGVAVALAAIAVVIFVFRRRKNKGVPYHLASLDSVRSNPSKMRNWSALSSTASNSPPRSQRGSLQNIGARQPSFPDDVQNQGMRQSATSYLSGVPENGLFTAQPTSSAVAGTSAAASSRHTSDVPTYYSQSPPSSPVAPSAVAATNEAVARARAFLPNFNEQTHPSRYDNITRYEPADLNRRPSTASQWTTDYSNYYTGSRPSSITGSVLSSTTGGLSRFGSKHRPNNNGWDESDVDSDLSESNNGWGRRYGGA